MPHSESAKKSLRRSKERQLRNKGVKSRITTETRKFKLAVEGMVPAADAKAIVQAQ